MVLYLPKTLILFVHSHAHDCSCHASLDIWTRMGIEPPTTGLVNNLSSTSYLFQIRPDCCKTELCCLWIAWFMAHITFLYYNSHSLMEITQLYRQTDTDAVCCSWQKVTFSHQTGSLLYTRSLCHSRNSRLGQQPRLSFRKCHQLLGTGSEPPLELAVLKRGVMRNFLHSSSVASLPTSVRCTGGIQRLDDLLGVKLFGSICSSVLLAVFVLLHLCHILKSDWKWRWHGWE